jgi:hypothetical protein
MPILKSLSFTALPKSGNDPVQTRRAKFVAKLNDCEGIVADFPVGHQVVRTNEVTGIDVALRDKLVDVDRPRRFQSDVFELFFRHLHVRVGIDLVALS